MAEAIRKDQQNQDLSKEVPSSPQQETAKSKISTLGSQTAQMSTRTVGKKSKAESPILQVR